MPDPKFGDQTIAKFINVMMQDGEEIHRRARALCALDTVGVVAPLNRSTSSTRRWRMAGS